MFRLAVLGFASVLLPAAAPVAADQLPGSSRTVPCVFRLHVNGNPGTSATFWVAYGPLHGRFGIIRLTRVGAHTFTARRNLPAGARTSFAYVEGQGTVHTRAGAAPGNPVITINTLGPLRLGARPLPLQRWAAPVG